MDVTNRPGRAACTTATAGASTPSHRSHDKELPMQNLPPPQQQHHNCTLAVVRALTRPFLVPPTLQQLPTALVEPWRVRIPVDTQDLPTQNHWREQPHTTPLFHSMLDWQEETKEETAATVVPINDHSDKCDTNSRNSNKKNTETAATPTSTASLHPYFSFGNATSPFFNPYEDVGNCLRQLLLHQIGCQQMLNHHITLTSHDTDLFVATAPNFCEANLRNLRISPQYYLLRCHYDKRQKQLQFGYHTSITSTRTRSTAVVSSGYTWTMDHSDDDDNNNDTGTDTDTMNGPIKKQKSEDDASANSTVSPFQILHTLSLKKDPDWRLKACILLQNLARILLCLKDFAIPLVCRPEKLSLIHDGASSSDNDVIQKVYTTPNICNIFNATVRNMRDIYQALEEANVPHSDRIVYHMEKEQDGTCVCHFAPVGRSYLPEVRMRVCVKLVNMESF